MVAQLSADFAWTGSDGDAAEIAAARPRSLIFDIYGDYARYRGGRVRLRALAELLSLFDVDPPTTRVTMARLRRDGWFDSDRDGRETIYALNDRSWRLLDEGRERIFHRGASPWLGTWSVVIYSVPETDRRARERVRRTLAWLGFGQLTGATWISPHDRLDRVREALADDANIRLDLLRASSGSLETDRSMAARAWDLEHVNANYQAVLDTLQERLPAYRSGQLDRARAFQERTKLTHWYRGLPFEDPDLPAEFLPEGWVGMLAHKAFLEAHELLRVSAEEHYVTVTTDNPAR